MVDGEPKTAGRLLSKVTEGFASRVEEARMVEIGMPRRVDSIRASSRLIGEPAVSARRTRLSPRRHRSGSPGSGGRGWEATPHSSFGRSLGGKYQHRSDNSSSHELQHGSTPFMSEKELTLSEGNAQRLGAVRREAILKTTRSTQATTTTMWRILPPETATKPTSRARGRALRGRKARSSNAETARPGQVEARTQPARSPHEKQRPAAARRAQRPARASANRRYRLSNW
jgi:hypothetical protein